MAKNTEAAQNEKSTKNGVLKETPQLPLFYKNPTPLDAKKHKSLSLKKDFGFSFTKNINAVPVNMVEMPQICHFYPIAFSPDENATPVAILGLRDNENLFLDAQDNWDMNTYIPAYIRRYPFIFSEIPDSDQLTLCIDHTEDITEESKERPLFNAEGAQSKAASIIWSN